MSIAVIRLNTGGKPKGVRKFFSSECVHPVPEQHEQPVHVFTGSPCGITSCPVWVCAGNEEKCVSLPCSAYWSIAAFLNWIFGKEGGRNCISKLGRERGFLRNYTAHHQFWGTIATPLGSSDVLQMRAPFSWEGFGLKTRKLFTIATMLMEGSLQLLIWSQLLLPDIMLSFFY